MENIIGILLVITFIALIAYSGSQIQKQEEKLRVESFKHKQKRDKVKLIIHQGAITNTIETNIEKIYKYNVDFSIKLFEKAIKYKIPIKYASSASVYGNQTNIINPLNFYAISKVIIDYWVTDHIDEFKLVQGFRYFNVYGPYEDHKGNQASPYTKFTKQAQEDKIIKVFEGSENYKRDFISVNDVCQIHEKMFQIDKSGIWNVGTGKPVSFDTVARTIADKHGAEIKYITMPDNLKSQYQKYTCADLTKLNSVIDHKWIDIKDYINGS